jgi:hypothetical protein
MRCLSPTSIAFFPEKKMDENMKNMYEYMFSVFKAERVGNKCGE